MTTEAPAYGNHRVCGTPLLAEMRLIISQPAEARWPRDSYVLVPFCPQCKAIIDFTSIDHHKPEKDNT